MGCASSTPLTASGPSPEAPPYDLRAADPGVLAGDGSVAGKVRQTVTGMADALPVQEMIDGVSNAKDDAFHKLQDMGESVKDKMEDFGDSVKEKVEDFGESVKDKVESVVEDVEDKIGSAFGTVKDKTAEATEEISTAEEEASNAIEEVEAATDDVEKKVEEKADEIVDTVVEDLEESLPQAEKQDSETKDFQMNTKGSRASTAELSRKSVEGSDTKENPAEEEGIEDQGQRNGGSDENQQKVAEEGNSIQEQDNQSEHESEKSGKISPTETPPVAGIDLDPIKDEILLEPPALMSEINTPVEAIPIDKQELSKEELKAEEEKEKPDEKEPLTVELPPEEEKKEMSPSMDENEPLSTDSGNQPSPAPHIDTPRPASDTTQENIEPPIEKTTITQAENHPGLELGTRTPSPDGKNDSAISSSSLSPEQERTESEMEERQKTPVIEVA